jgi:hypothetical protein
MAIGRALVFTSNNFENIYIHSQNDMKRLQGNNYGEAGKAPRDLSWSLFMTEKKSDQIKVFFFFLSLVFVNTLF